MRDVNDSKTERTLQPGGWLHLDVSRGASGTLIAGALLHLGVPARVVREAFDQAGLHAIGLLITTVTRPGTHGVHVELVDEEGHLLRATETPAQPRRPSPRAPLRRRHQAPHIDVRPAAARKAMGIAQADESGAASEEDGFDREIGKGEPHAEVFLMGQGTTAPEAEEPKRPTPLQAWLRDEAVSPAALLSFVGASELAPVPKAIAQKALRRALEARADAFGHDRLDEATLPGRFGLELLGEAIACAALLGALSPARVSASAICLDVAADPWLDAVLVGMRAREEDVGFSPTTPLGAALVWAVAHRSGPRGDVVTRRAGSGVGRALLRGRPEVSRALYGEDVLIDTRAQVAGSVDVRRIEAVLEGGDRAALISALTLAGASGITTAAALSGDGRAWDRLLCSAPPAAVDEVTQLLFSAAAREVLVSTAERRQPERREVTVSVGRGKRRELVRLTELRARGSVLSVEPSRRDLEEAASRLGASVDALSHEALLAYEELGLGGTEER